jgi:O-antigen/teichoic acid export membrane protein
VFLFLIAKPFFHVWAGEEYAIRSAPMFDIILIGMGFNIVSYLPYAAIMAAGRTDIFAKLYAAELVPYFLLLTGLTFYYGGIGTAVAWSTRTIVDCFLLLYLAKRAGKVSTSSVRIISFGTSSTVFIPPIAAFLFFSVDMAIVASLFVIASLTYIVVLWKTVLRREERDWARGQLFSFLRFVQ